MGLETAITWDDKHLGGPERHAARARHADAILMSEPVHSNGYVRLTTLVGVAVPILTIFAAAIAIYVSMSIAPISGQIKGIQDDLRDIHQDLVPRKEHDRDWEAEKDRFADLQRQIDANKNDLHDMYNAHDALSDLSTRLRMLEERNSQKPEK